jgi:hypothetical protein
MSIRIPPELARTRKCWFGPLAAATFFEQPQLSQHTRGIGPRHHARAYFAQFRRSLINRGVEARAVERYSGCHAADSAADDADIECAPIHGQESIV